ncbi:MAG: arsenate reductase ArsC [Brockia lithotrophica]|nr:arsenate reductase ArsC [Brockia lithotrophica]
MVEITSKPFVYFLCTGNSARSQMAEGWLRHLAGDRVVVASAGFEPSFVHPLAIRVMAEVGIDISGHTSKAIDRDLLHRAFYAVTLCGDAEERCPYTPPHVRREFWPLPDPARVHGTEEERLRMFRFVRDELGKKMPEFLSRVLDAWERRYEEPSLRAPVSEIFLSPDHLSGGRSARRE